jgi:hypothetical protein
MGLVNAGNVTTKNRQLTTLSMSGSSAMAGKFGERPGSTSTAPSCSSYGYSSGQSSIASSASGSGSAGGVGSVGGGSHGNGTVIGVNGGADKSTTSALDEQLKELDKRLTSKDSIIRALRSERERYPNHFWKI